MSDKIIVSICCITFNHSKYIRECLDGFLMQECDFDFEILIHDDASTDGTIEIIKEYQDKYPEIIKPYIQKENQWSQGVRGMNAKYNFSRAKGKYIALCEGDDFWTDPLKLQRQVDFLEENEDYTICFHDIKILEDEKLRIDENIEGRYLNIIDKSNIDYKDLLIHGNFIHTCSVLFRNLKNYNDLDLIMKFSSVGDYILHIHNAKFGKIKKLDFYGGIYRRGVGIYSTLDHEDFLYARLKYLICILKMVSLEEDLAIIHNQIDNHLKDIKKYKLKERSEIYKELTIKDHLIEILKKNSKIFKVIMFLKEIIK